MDGRAGLKVEATELAAVPLEFAQAREQVAGGVAGPAVRPGKVGLGEAPEQPGVEPIGAVRCAEAGQRAPSFRDASRCDERAYRDQAGQPRVLVQTERAERFGEPVRPPRGCRRSRAGGQFGTEHDERGERRPERVSPAEEPDPGARRPLTGGLRLAGEQRRLGPGQLRLRVVLAEPLPAELVQRRRQLPVGLAEESGGEQRPGAIDGEHRQERWRQRGVLPRCRVERPQRGGQVAGQVVEEA